MTLKFDSNGGKKVFTFTFIDGGNFDCAVDVGSWATVTTSSTNNTITVSVECDENSEESERNGIISPVVDRTVCNKKGVNIIQSGSKPEPEVCDCDEDFEIGNETFTFAWDDLERDWTNVTASQCITDVSANDTEHFKVSASTSEIVIQPKGENETGSDIEEDTVVTYKASEKDCSKSIHIIQYKQECSCDGIPSESPTWEADEYGIDVKKKIFTLKPCCDELTVISSLAFSTLVEGTAENIFVYAYPVTANTSYTNSISDTVSISANCGGDCSNNTTIIQNAAECKCDDLRIDTTEITVNVGASITRPYTADCTIESDISVSSSDENIVEANISNGVIVINGKRNGNATITISHSVGGTECDGIEINVTVTCLEWTITHDGNGSCSGGTVNFSVN